MSLVFKDSPQTSSLVVLMNLVGCSKSALEPQNFSANVLWAMLCLCVLVQGGRTAEHALRFVDLSHTVDCVTDQGDTGGHTVGSNQSVVRGFSTTCSKSIICQFWHALP